MRRRYHDATHHCWAVRLWNVRPARDGGPGEPAREYSSSDEPRGPRVDAIPEERLTERWSDDGEPSGTAGPPLVHVLQGAGISNALLVVTRYFGGTKLGTGGLVRAYTDAGREALQAASPRIIWKLAELSAEFSYDLLGIVEGVLARAGDGVHRVTRTDAPGPRFLIQVRRSRAKTIIEALIEATAGQAKVDGPPPAGRG